MTGAITVLTQANTTLSVESRKLFFSFLSVSTRRNQASRRLQWGCFLRPLMLWLLYHILFAFWDCATSLCFVQVLQIAFVISDELWKMSNQLTMLSLVSWIALCCDRIGLKENAFSPSLKFQRAFELCVTGLKIMKGVGMCQSNAAGFVRLLPRWKTFHIVIVYFSRLKCLCVCASLDASSAGIIRECQYVFQYVVFPWCFYFFSFFFKRWFYVNVAIGLI